jgi:predicted O-methyltransferase YrrM
MNDIIYKSDDSTITELVKPTSGSVLSSINYFNTYVEPNVTGWFYMFDHIIIHQLMVNLQSESIGDVAEIGVAFGKSTIALSNYRRKGEMLYLFDVFTEHERQLAVQNLVTYGTYDDFEWHIGDTTKLTPNTVPVSSKLRFLHIDGCHEHRAVYLDLFNFSQHMTDDGIIVLDDYTDPEYPGVNSGATQFLLENIDWCIFAIGQNKCYLCKNRYYSFYASQLLTCLDFIKHEHGAEYQFNLRQVLSTNVLLCCSREDTPVEQIKADLHTEMKLR